MNCRVLIATSDALVSSLLTEALASAGHAVQFDADGPSAMSRLEAAPFDVVVCDLLLGRVHALDLLGAAKRCRMPVALIFITDQGSVEDAVGWLKAGADDYVTSPFDAGELVARIELSAERARFTPIFTRATECRPLAESMKQCERECLVAALHATHGIKFKAARLLGISRKTLWEKLKAHCIKEFSPDDDAGSDAGGEQFSAPA